MKKLSRFDLIIIIVFVVITLLGGGACYYLSGLLGAAQQDAGTADSDFNKYTKNETYLPTKANEAILKNNIDQINAVLDPLIQDKLRSKDNLIYSVVRQDALAWKNDLKNRLQKLNDSAKHNAVVVPVNFQYSFTTFLTKNPEEDKTAVLSKQLLGVEQIANILINAHIRNIKAFRRTYEENDSLGNSPANNYNTNEESADQDLLGGNAVNVDGGIYTDYPFQVEFEGTTDNLRKIVNDLIQSPYVFVIRNITIENSKTNSPLTTDLDKLAGPSAGSSRDPAPSDTAPAPKTIKGPQYLFGGEYLKIKLRVDMIEWNGTDTETAPATNGPSGNGRRSAALAPAGDNR